MAIDISWVANGVKPKIAYMGDSWLTDETNISGHVSSRLGGVSVVNSAVPSTGFVSAVAGVPYSDDSRIKQIVDSDPDVVIIFGSVNDSLIIDNVGEQKVGASVKDTLTSIRKSLPSVPIIVTGQQETSAYRSRSSQTALYQKTVRDAVSSFSGVSFIDQIGIFQEPPIFHPATEIKKDTVFHHNGVNYVALEDWTPGAALPQHPASPTRKVSLFFTGTGKVDAKKGDGNRDSYLTSDELHLTPEGVLPYVEALSSKVESSLIAMKGWIMANNQNGSEKIRGWDQATATSGVGKTLSATSEVGDTALIIMAGQLSPETETTIPSGWQGVSQKSISGTSRSGYIAKLKVTSPEQTQNVQWFDKRTAWTARQVGILVVLKEVGDIDIAGGWSLEKPSINSESLVFSQSHGPAQNTPMEWAADEIIWDGKGSVLEGQSWSNVRFAKTATSPVEGAGNPVSAWFSVTLTLPAGVSPSLVSFSRWVDGREEPANSVGVMPTGCLTNASLMGKEDFVVAHRGGSQDWPEHTAFAYTQAMSYGCDALEISCGRTSDGVWFACHDQNLARLGGPTTAVDKMIWAEVEESMRGNVNMPARLDWLLETYGDSTVIVFDPKYAAAKHAEFLKILEPFKKNTFIKYMGDAAWLFSTAKNAGFGTWGYSYESNKDLDWFEGYLNSPSLDILSLEFTASKDLWDRALQTGKVLTSHIPSAEEHVTMGKSKGARGTISARPTTHLTRKV